MPAGTCSGVPSPRYVNTAMLKQQHQAIQFDVGELAHVPIYDRVAAAERIIRAQVQFNGDVVIFLENVERTMRG